MNPAQLLLSYEHIYETVSEGRSRNLEGQLGFFDYVEENHGDDMSIPPMEEYSSPQLMKLEKEALGFYATGHPLDSFDKYIRLNGYKHISEITGENSGSIVKDGTKLSLIALLSAKKNHVTKTGKQMCFATFEDSTGEIEGIVFDDVYSKAAGLLSKSDCPLIIHGTVSLSAESDETAKIIVNAIESGEDIKLPDFSTLFIRVGSDEREKIARIAALLEGKGGKERVRLAFSDSREVSAIKGIENVHITKELLDKLAKICGKSNIILK